MIPTKEQTMQILKSLPAGKAGQIMLVDGLIDPAVCSEFLTKCESVWYAAHQGKTMGGVDYAIKTTEDLHVSHLAFAKIELQWDDAWQRLESTFSNSLGTAIAMFKQEYRHLDHWTAVGDTGFQIQKYYKNFGFYRPHVDSFPGGTVGDRVLACVIYLNTVDYGGETHFPLHEVKIQPKAGRIVLFPATWTHLHESCSAITGDKWIISTFIVNLDVTPEVPGSLPGQEPEHVHDENTHTHDDEPPLILGTEPWPA